MAKKVDKTEDQLANVEQALGKTEQFIESNQKNITYGIAGLIVVVLLVMGYNRYIAQPKELNAFNAMHYAEHYFEIDSFKVALDGDGINPGFLKIIDEYGRTTSGNLAEYYAGLCYMHLAMKDTTTARNEMFESAIDHLKNFSADDDLVTPMALGAIGDAYDELNEQDKAVDYYLKAANAADNKFSTPLFLMKAGLMYSAMDKHDKALEMYERIKKDYYTSNEGRNIKKYIAMEKELLK
jgi:tetratricopeptide (TPR) repeat protein